MTHLEQVYKRHGIYDVPDPDLHEPIPEPFSDFEQFETDVAAALVLDGKRTPPKPKPVPVWLQPGEQVLTKGNYPPFNRTPGGHPCTPGCVCSTPQIVNADVISVVYRDEPQIACWMCGRILTVDHDAFDERVRARALTIAEEQFMVDQVCPPITLHLRR